MQDCPGPAARACGQEAPAPSGPQAVCAPPARSQERLAAFGRRGFWLDPRSKVLLLLCSNVVLLASGSDATGLTLRTLVAVAVAGLLVTAGRRRASLAFSTVFAAAVLFQHFSQQGLLNALGSTSVIAVTLRLLAALMLQFLPGTMFAYYLFATTKVSEFVAAMERLRLPQWLVIPFAVVFRFFPTALEERRSIRDAMRLRGVDWRSGPFVLVEYRLVPLIASMVKIGDELSAASLTRGLGGPAKRTCRCRIGFGPIDAVLAAAFLALAALTIAKGMAG